VAPINIVILIKPRVATKSYIFTDIMMILLRAISLSYHHLTVLSGNVIMTTKGSTRFSCSYVMIYTCVCSIYQHYKCSPT